MFNSCWGMALWLKHSARDGPPVIPAPKGRHREFWGKLAIKTILFHSSSSDRPCPQGGEGSRETPDINFVPLHAHANMFTFTHRGGQTRASTPSYHIP